MGPESPIAVDPRSPIEPEVLSPISRFGVGHCVSSVQTLQLFEVVLDGSSRQHNGGITP